MPGITSAIGLTTSLGLPVTLRGVASGFAVVAGETTSDAGWARYAGVDTLVVLMGVRRRRQIARALVASGRPASEPVAFVQDGSTARQRILASTLGDVAAGLAEVASPAVWIIGQVTSPAHWHAPGGSTLDQSVLTV